MPSDRGAVGVSEERIGGARGEEGRDRSITIMDLPDDPEDPTDMVATARRDFAWYYEKATPLDTTLMDNFVRGLAAMTVLINTPRENVAPEIRRHLERTTDAVDQLFAAQREAVRACPTFTALSVGEQHAIERVLFAVRPAWFP